MGAIARLTRRSEFLKVAAGRRKSVTPGLILQALDNPDLIAENPFRIGYTASRKVGNAVKRNRAKRRLRALAAEILPEKAAPGRDYVLIARSETVTRPFADLRGDLIQALRRLDRQVQR